jgi:hypothetical protein
MASPPIPPDIRRFVLTSIASVPHLEALLLLRADAADFWSDSALAQRLYIAETVAHGLMADLCHAGMLIPQPCGDHAISYRYQPTTEALRHIIDALADLYARQLVDITLLIHSKLDRKAQLFADAFKWRKDS